MTQKTIEKVRAYVHSVHDLESALILPDGKVYGRFRNPPWLPADGGRETTRYLGDVDDILREIHQGLLESLQGGVLC